MDCATAPGSWAQYASEKVGPRGRIVGIDLTAVDLRLANVTTLQADVFKWQPEVALHRSFDVLMSDMMSNTTGM